MSPAQPVVSAPVTTQAVDDSSLSQENRTDPQGISPDETSGDLATLVSSLKEQIQSGFKSLSDRLDTIEEQHHELHGVVSSI